MGSIQGAPAYCCQQYGVAGLANVQRLHRQRLACGVYCCAAYVRLLIAETGALGTASGCECLQRHLRDLRADAVAWKHRDMVGAGRSANKHPPDRLRLRQAVKAGRDGSACELSTGEHSVTTITRMRLILNECRRQTLSILLGDIQENV